MEISKKALEEFKKRAEANFQEEKEVCEITCEPGMKKCGACEKKEACKENPYRARGLELKTMDWYGHSGLRGRLMMLDESKYEALFDLIVGPNWYIDQLPNIKPETNRELKIETIRTEIISLERVHRMLLGMKERQEIKLTDPLPEIQVP